MRAANGHVNIMKLLGFGAAAALLALAPENASAGKFKVLHSFCTKGDCLDGEEPTAPLTMDPTGNFFGTTSVGGKHILGTAFELENAGNGKYHLKTIFSFSQSPNNGALVIDSAGNLYGFAGGFFKLSYGFGAHHDKWGITDQQVSCSAGDCGTSPIGNLAYTGESSGAPYDGTSPLYGAMQSGGSNGSGLVYELTPNGVNTWTETVLYNFCSSGGDKCTDGKFPSGGLSLDSTGNLFGLTQQGGNNFDSTGAGVAFEISPNQGSWTETTLYQFCSVANCTDGAMPVGGLAADAAGVLYGVTLAGGSCKRAKSFGCGTAFSLIPAGGNTQEAVLYTFCTKRDCRDGSFPEAGLILDGSGNLFGTTETGGGNDIDDRQQGGGVAYEISGTSLNVLHSFCSLAGCADGEYPAAQLIFDENGNLMGTATVGGAFGSGTSGGTVFQIR